MEQPTTVIYNESCPICSREIGIYRERAEAHDLPIGFTDLNASDLDALGLTPEMAARRLHVVENGQLVGGVDAFVVLWRALPGFGWLARLVSRPIIRPVAHLVYDHILAPLLYAMHRRRERRAVAKAPANR